MKLLQLGLHIKNKASKMKKMNFEDLHKPPLEQVLK